MNQKTLSILGDSISTFQGYIPEGNEIYYPKEGNDVMKVEETWWHLLLQKQNMKLFMNEAYSGSRISRTGLRPLTSSFLDEIRQNKLGGDYIIVFGGTNDWGQIDQPTTKEIFADAYEELVSSMLARHTQSELYFCTPLMRTDRSLDTPNIHGWTQNELHTIIRSTVQKHSKAHLIDLAKYEITEGDGMLFDGLHPTKKGMVMLSELMEQCLFG